MTFFTSTVSRKGHEKGHGKKEKSWSPHHQSHPLKARTIRSRAHKHIRHTHTAYTHAPLSFPLHFLSPPGTLQQNSLETKLLNSPSKQKKRIYEAENTAVWNTFRASFPRRGGNFVVVNGKVLFTFCCCYYCYFDLLPFSWRYLLAAFCTAGVQPSAGLSAVRRVYLVYERDILGEKERTTYPYTGTTVGSRLRR